MSELARHRRYVVWGALTVALTIVAVLALVPTQAWVALDVRRSSLRTTPDGVAAWAQSLDRLGIPVARRHRSLIEDPPRPGVVVVLEPIVKPTPAEVRTLLAWVREGGTLVYSPAFESELGDSLGVSLEILPSVPFEEGPRDSLLAHPWTERGRAGPTSSSWILVADSLRAATWVPLSAAGDNALPTLAWLPEGEGGVLVLAAAEELANRTLEGSLSAVTITRAVADHLPAGDSVYFSEYHQGLDGRRGILRETLALASASRFGRVSLLVAATGFFGLLLIGRRFGTPLPEPPGVRRSTLEHVEALADIYGAARAHGTVARNLIRGAARRMGTPPTTGSGSERELLTRWSRRPELAEPAGHATAALDASPPDLTTLERALDAIVTRHTTHLPRS